MKTAIKYSLAAVMLYLANVASADKVCQKLTLAGKKIKQHITTTPSAIPCPKGSAEIIDTDTLIGAIGDQGEQGPPGPAGGFQPTLPSGELMQGLYGSTMTATAAGNYLADTQTFPFKLPTDIIETHYIKVGDPAIPECPGTAESPDAQAGHLCLFERIASNRSPGVVVINTVAGSASLTNWRLGFTVQSTSSDAGDMSMYGSYAVRAE